MQEATMKFPTDTILVVFDGTLRHSFESRFEDQEADHSRQIAVA